MLRARNGSPKVEDNRVAMWLNTPIAQSAYLPNGPIPGLLFGVELELEGEGVGLNEVRPQNWKRMEEGSLRGECMEWVFAKPQDYEKSVKMVDALFKKMKENNVKIADSFRTSTHVHLNFSDKTAKQALNFFLLHTVIEELLANYCGATRNGNLFCLSCRDTEQLLELLDNGIYNFGGFGAIGKDMRYNACNLASLNTFGSIEIRTMRGASDAETVNKWLDILNQMYVFACSDDCPEPWKLCERLSHLGTMGFLRQFFRQDTINELMASWPPVADLQRSLMNGVRLIQMFAYGLQEDWLKKVEVPKVEYDAVPAPGKGARGDPAGMDRLELAPNSFWWVGFADQTATGARDHTPHGEIIFDRAMQCWYYVDGWVPIRWTIYNGVNFQKGSANDRMYNKEYYAFPHQPVEDEQDEEEDEY
jgi:hypothetical protein